MASTITTPNGSGPLLEQARTRRGLSLEDMAQESGIDPAALEAIERDGIGGGMGIDEFAALAHAYRLTMAQIAQAAERGSLDE